MAPGQPSRILTDLSELVPFSERVDQTRVPGANDFIIERHRPTMFDIPYHHHTSLEINFLQDCEMSYSFSGTDARLLPDRLTVFWGAAPHRVTRVAGQGQITNLYLSLGQVVRWGLPPGFVDALLGGSVICARSGAGGDAQLLDRLYAERGAGSAHWRRLHLAEIETRLRRLALEGWTTLLEQHSPPIENELSSQAVGHVEEMLRFIADNFTLPVNVRDIARATNLSPGRAGLLFRKMMGVSLKQQLQRARLSHARMLLTETEEKVATIALDSGFSSLSAFYDAFTKANGQSPAGYRNQARCSTSFVAEHSQIAASG